MALGVRGPGNASPSPARIGLYSTIGAAVVGLGATVGFGMIPDDAVSLSPTPTSPQVTQAAMTITPTASPGSNVDSGIRIVIDPAGAVTVSGAAQPDVAGIYVLIGPKPTGGFWGTYTAVSNQQWRAVVTTDPPWEGLPIRVQPVRKRTVDATPPASPVKLTSRAGQEPPQPPYPDPYPYPDQVLQCAETYGPSCFNGPQFGTPSIYQ